MQDVVQRYAYFLETSKVFCYVSSLCLNVCVCIDLVLMVKNPFTKQSSRMTCYLYGSIIGGSLVTLGEVFSLHREIASEIIELTAYSIFILTALFSSVTACRMLTKPGVSIELRKLMMSRHMAYTILYATCNLFVAVRNVLFLGNVN